MKNLISLTPRQQEIENIIDSTIINPAHSAELLRQLSDIADNLKSTLHYHGGDYEKHLVQKAEELISEIKGF